ncbi:MAG: GNAT family N-acetyltransferase [Thermodesulfobacteriota bacterium]
MTLEIEIKTGYIPGAIGRVAELHGKYYHRHWGFGSFFEAKVAIGLSEFINRYNQSRDCFWSALLNEQIEGSITIDGIHAEDEGAHLRWYIVSDLLRGRGVGNMLIQSAVQFCREKRYKKIFLWTFEGLDPARHLYEKFGFRLIEQRRGNQWGKEVQEQRFELTL